MEEIAIAIPFKVWKDPQGDIVLHYSLQGCDIYFGCWITNIEPADYLCKVTFHHGWAVRGYCLEYVPYEIKEHHYRSCLYSVENSKWLEELTNRRLSAYPNWKQWDSKVYRHYVISGHDNYYEIIAADFTETIIPRDEAGDLLRLIHEA